MRVVKFEHACVRVESTAAVLVIDPGGFTTRRALDGVDAVLITHEHADHLDLDALTGALASRPAVQIFTHPAVTALLGDLAEITTTVQAGQQFTAAGMRVRAYGGWHAVIHPDLAPVPNLGYLVEERLYHPGDSFDVPQDAQVDTLLVPVSGPWLKLAEAVDFVRAVAPRQAYTMHDVLLAQPGVMVTNGNMTNLCDCEYLRLEPGETVEVPG